MRELIAGPVKVNRGETVELYARLPSGVDYAFCEVYSAVVGFEPSPHVPIHKMFLLGDERKPVMVSGTTMRLNRAGGRIDTSVKLKADEDCEFFLFQNIDRADDPKIKGYISHDGTLAARATAEIRRMVRNARRFLRSRYDCALGRKRA